MSNRRVVITGMGVITSLGSDVETLWNNIKNGKSGISYIELFDTTKFMTKIGAEIKDFVPEDHFDRKLSQRMDRFCQYGFAAALKAVESSELEKFSSLNKARVGVVVGSGIGGLTTLQANMSSLIQKGPKKLSPMTVPSSILDIVSGYVAIEYGFMGPNYGVTSACATGGHSLMTAYNTIRLEDADVMIAGGCEAAITEFGIAAFNQARALSVANDEPEKACRPFDIARDGFVMGEGAGILVLEEYEHARKRGAKIYGEMVSYAATADAYHITAPHPEGIGAATAMDIAIKRANLVKEDIGLINMHGTSTPLGDIAETQAIKKVFGDHAYKLHCNSTKSMLGHSLGASGAIEAIMVLKMLEEGIIHPTINIDNPDPECDLNYTPKIAVKKSVDFALSNSFGFGGHNVSLLFKKI